MIQTQAQIQKQLKVFGYGLPLICAFLAWRQYANHGLTAWVVGFIIVGLAVLALAIFDRARLRIVFDRWMQATAVIGIVVTTFILSTFFLVIMTPVAIFLRLSGKDYLRVRRGVAVDSYWIKRSSQVDTATKQF